jgi:hypothetical protein
MEPHQPSGAANAAYAIVTTLLILTVAVGALRLTSAVVGAARDGRTLLGEPANVSVTLPALHRVPPGVKLSSDLDGRLEPRDPTAKQVLLVGALELIAWPLLVAGLWLLRGVALSVKDGDPFGAANVRRLRGIGMLLLLGVPLVAIVNGFLRQAMFDTLHLSDATGIAAKGIHFPLEAFAAALGAFVLAEVFAHGVRLREDVDATV